MSKDKQTLSVYDAKVADYVKMGENDEESSDLDGFMSALPKGGKVLDLGCGPGTKAAIMMKAGFEVDAVDASEGMVDFARSERGVNARVAQFDEISGEDIYDGVLASFSLLHAPKSEFSTHLANLRKALKPNGAFHLGMKLGEGEERDSLGRFYAYYSEDELMDLLKAAGFILLDKKLGTGKGLSGTDDHWIVVLARV